jgi:amino-acid N-acetyltransferase
MKKKKPRSITIRKARVFDVMAIHHLINSYARRKIMLPRSLNHIYDNIRDYFVAESIRGKIIACCALHVAWEDLAEVKSLAVNRDYQRKHVGTKLLFKCLGEAKQLGAKRVFALTYVPKFFIANGFKRISKTKLPGKIWRECIDCPLFPDCEEIAVVKVLAEE